MRRRLPAGRPHVSIDVSIAIVNIVLLLIFFFLVTGQMTGNGEDEGVTLSETSRLHVEQLPRPVLIVAPSGEWTLDGRPVAPELLGVALDAMPQPVRLHVLIDRAAPADALVKVLAQPGVRDRAVSLVTARRRAAP